MIGPFPLEGVVREGGGKGEGGRKKKPSRRKSMDKTNF